MSSQELVLLQKERAKAIEDCEFQKAKAIDIHIKRLTAQIQHNNQTKKRIGNELMYESEKEAVRKEASLLFSDAYEEIYAIKAKFQDRMATLHRNHAEQLKRHADSYSCDLELCSTRGVPDAVFLKKEAQSKARNGEFELADSLFQQSKQARAQTIAEREAEVHKIYALKSDQITKKQREENELCKEKEKIAIAEIVQKYDTEVTKLKRRLAAAAQKLQISPDLDEEESFFERLEPDEDTAAPSERSSVISEKSATSPSPRKTRQSALTSPKRRSPHASTGKLSPH
ncbi:hypothetical protein TRFO_10276 [Tritrichomonas foetus]|uniref:Uncharacterized protein n=1 Tax=Tritrichomonas foetus TaxID=1144522 RepID=A0A1J4JEK7_9EUKA|nr:hypothetical protein TRFO_10276 [Tritrichomonas foetus]|eukprot:OHS95869.1 hypothetical protein TRFO_10276 [Tritrichomonas foetus]